MLICKLSKYVQVMLLELSWKHWIVPCSLMIPDPSVFNLSWKHWILPSPGHFQTANVYPIGQNSQRSPDLDTPTHHELAHHDLAPPSPYQITNFDLTWTHQVKDVDCTVSLGLPLAVKVQELLLTLQSWGKCGLQHKLKSCKSLFRWPSLSCREREPKTEAEIPARDTQKTSFEAPMLVFCVFFSRWFTVLFLAGSLWKVLASQHCYHDRQPEQLLL